MFQEEPNAYVKVYLHPDPTKITKRKTKVVKKNCNPSFMEMLEYRIPLDVVKCRTLQARVATNFFEDFGGALNTAFIRGREPVSIIHYARPGTFINHPLH